MIRIELTAIVLLFAASFQPATSAEPTPPPGAMACSGCHATQSRSDDAIPSIIGMKADDIVAAMQDFRQGERSPTVMDRIAKGFSGEEVRAIAEWLEKHPEGARQ